MVTNTEISKANKEKMEEQENGKTIIRWSHGGKETDKSCHIMDFSKSIKAK
jgi:hypothetical protein